MARNLWAASAVVMALVSLTPAHAQAGEAAAPVAPVAGDGGHQIGDIVVTASRRSESVQESSLSIAVLGGEALAQKGVSEAGDLNAVVPGLTISFGGGSAQTYLRGVGSFATDASAESAIAYSINGVYISRPNGIGPIFFDLDRVEVLKGPQGTLYGRNATGGAINLITRRPAPGLSTDWSVDVGNYDLVKVSGAVGGGTEKFAMRGAFQYAKHDGYLSDGYDDQDSIASRLMALWKPVDQVSLLVTGEYARMQSQGAGVVKRSTLTALPNDHWEGPSVGNTQQPPTAFIPGGTRITDNGFNDTRVAAISAELNVDFDAATLTFIPAYRDTRAAYLTYTPGFYFNTAETSQQQSYELRLGHDSGRLKWLVGGFYFDEQQTQLYELQAIPIQLGTTQTDLSTKAYAVFGDATLSLTDSFRLLGGVRYSKDKKRQTGASLAVLPSPATTDNYGRRSFDNVSWRAGAEADVGPNSMLFATASTGYKAGGFFPSVPFPNNSFKPEKLTAFTVGSRNQFLDRTLQVNLEGFYWKYDDKQERFLGATPSGTTGLLTTNAGKATLYGGNIDLLYRPTRADTLRFAVEYLHSKYDSFTYSVYNASVPPVLNSYPAEATSCRIGPVEPYTSNDFVPALRYDSRQTIDCAGKPLVRAPRWTGSAGYQHSFDLGGDSRLIAGVDGQFSSSQYLSPDFIQSGRDNGYFTLNADLIYEMGHGVTLSAWGRNLTKEAIYSGGGRYPFSRGVAAGGDPTLFYANIRAPRTYGGTLRWHY